MAIWYKYIGHCIVFLLNAQNNSCYNLLCDTGDTGQGARTWIKQILNQDMAFQHIKVIYPTAPARYCLKYFNCGIKLLYSNTVKHTCEY